MCCAGDGLRILDANRVKMRIGDTVVVVWSWFSGPRAARMLPGLPGSPVSDASQKR